MLAQLTDLDRRYEVGYGHLHRYCLLNVGHLMLLRRTRSEVRTSQSRAYEEAHGTG